MKALLASRSFAHFAVDLACGFVALGVFVPGTATLGLGIESAMPMEVTVGGATIIVTNVERFEKL